MPALVKDLPPDCQYQPLEHNTELSELQPLAIMGPLIINPFTKPEPTVKKADWALRNENGQHDLCCEPAPGLMSRADPL